MGKLFGSIGGTSNPKLVFNVWGELVEADTVARPQQLLWAWDRDSELKSLVDYTELEVNLRHRLNLTFVYRWLSRDDELTWQLAAQADEVLVWPHKDCERYWPMRVEGPWRRQWSAGRATGHQNEVRLVALNLERVTYDLGNLFAFGVAGGGFGASWPPAMPYVGGGTSGRYP